MCGVTVEKKKHSTILLLVKSCWQERKDYFLVKISRVETSHPFDNPSQQKQHQQSIIIMGSVYWNEVEYDH